MGVACEMLCGARLSPCPYGTSHEHAPSDHQRVCDFPAAVDDIMELKLKPPKVSQSSVSWTAKALKRMCYFYHRD